MATEKCKSQFHTFGDCAKANGIMVVFKCRSENRAISDCLDKHYNENVFRSFMGTKGFEWEQKKGSSGATDGVFIRVAKCTVSCDR